jgi:SAM-dependent methyltransferase
MAREDTRAVVSTAPTRRSRALGADYADPMANYTEHFALVAPRYDALREEATDEVVGWIAEASHLAREQAFVDIGCGTGAMTVALARRFALDAVGIDPSPEMLSGAPDHVAATCRFVRGRAEQLPFPEDSFDRALMQTAVHLMERPKAFREARRVLRADGLLTVFTVDPAGVDEFWLATWFPSYASIDRRRFPTEAALTVELATAGFQQVKTQRRARKLAFTRERALTMLRSRFASSFVVMSDAEYEAGVQRAERDMPATFVSTLRILILTAR